jgi:hypothetical protein
MNEPLADEIIRPNERFKKAGIVLPKVDELISRIVGKTVYINDPRLIKMIVVRRRNKPMDSLQPDNFLQDPTFIKELKEIFG